MKHIRRAFTLTEVLVVMGIMVLLAGIVYAGLAPARERARQTGCVSNLRQIGAALTMYRSDFDGLEPDGPRQYSELGLPPASAFGRYGNGGAFAGGYVKEPRMWICPTDPCLFGPADPPECRDDMRRCCTTYVLDPDWHAGTFSPIVDRCRDRLPLFHCRRHGIEQGISSYAIVLRWNGQVKGQYLQEPRTPCYD